MKSILKSTSIIIAITFLFFNISTAQSKIEVTIGLSYYKKADRSKIAVALIKKNENGKFVFAKNAKVNFYVIHDKEEQLLKSENTDNHGQAIIQVQNDLPLDDSLYFTLSLIHISEPTR